MSEKILKALMHLFAIIAGPQSSDTDRRKIVESFLAQQLNRDLVNEYLLIFDDFFKLYQKKQSIKVKRAKSLSLSSVKVLRICTEINAELTQKQKFVVLIRLLEFIKSEKEPSKQELEFVNTVAEIFNINEIEYSRILIFVLNSLEDIPDSDKLLFIDSKPVSKTIKSKFIKADGLNGRIVILNLTSANMLVMRYFGSDEIYLNGQLLSHNKVHILNTGSSIRNSRIKTIYFSDIIGLFSETPVSQKIIFKVKNVEYRFKGNKIGLHDFSINEESGKIVGIMGASGAGKSTLINVLNGTYKPTKGEVLINGRNIYTQKDEIAGLIGYVSQDDLLIEELTVFQNLYFNAKLCFGNYNKFQLKSAVDKILNSLGLYDIKDMVVGNPLNKKVSGGQRKRLNIALELIREPSILFLDEPTSGLSSRDSENIMDLLKELALKGKLIFVVIHQPSSDIFKMFDKLLILDTGGYVIYNGDPVDSIIYFKSRTHQANWNESECHICGNVNPEQVFNIVESGVIDEYGNITHTRKTTPAEWNDYYKEYISDSKMEIEDPDTIPKISFKIPGKIKQFLVFTTRDVLSKLTNTQYLIINLLEAPLLAFLLSYIIRYYNIDVANQLGYTYSENSNMPVYLFMSVIVALFIGLTVSAEEIIKDRRILKRESFLNLSRASYLGSKVIILLVLSAIQAFTFVIIGNTILEIRGMYFQYWLVLFSALTMSNLLGLNISDSFKTAVTIYILIPFLIIPQLILSGVIVKFDKLNPDISLPSKIPFYGEIITARWAYEALAVYQFKNNEFEEQFYPYDKILSQADFKKNYWVRALLNKAVYCERNLNNPDKKENLNESLNLLFNEISRENIKNKKIKFNEIGKLNFNDINISVIKNCKKYLNKLNTYYIKRYNKANVLKDNFIAQLQSTEEGKQKFLNDKKAFKNKSLTDLVTNETSLDRIVEFEGRLYQKIDPIYQEPESNFLWAHFYAPEKQLFGHYFDTFWINILVIWSMSIFLYITLYFKALKRLLDTFEHWAEKLRPGGKN